MNFYLSIFLLIIKNEKLRVNFIKSNRIDGDPRRKILNKIKRKKLLSNEIEKYFKIFLQVFSATENSICYIEAYIFIVKSISRISTRSFKTFRWLHSNFLSPFPGQPSEFRWKLLSRMISFYFHPLLPPEALQNFVFFDLENFP